MKQLIKQITPTPLWITARESYSKMRLYAVPKDHFKPDNLRPQSSIPLENIYDDDAIADYWHKDHEDIIKLYGDKDKIGGVNPGDRRAIYYLIMALKPKSILEVGTHIGASTLHIARSLKRLGQNGTVTTVDITDVNDPENGAWKKQGLKACPRDFAFQLECAEHIKFETAPCLDFMSKTDKKFDFIFLDGDHMAEAVYKEVGAALPLLNEGGTILLHDYYPDAKPLFPDKNIIGGPYFAMKRIKRENPEIETLPLGELPWPTKQGSHMTSLALVVKKDDNKS